jgi:hypothetical protein
MDGELLSYVYHRLFGQDSACARVGRRCTYSDALVALIGVYAAGSDRSPRWAQDRRNWPLWARQALPRPFPSYSQLMRRLASCAGGAAGQRARRRGARARLPRGGDKVCDGKALLVGGFSKDPDARRGKCPGGWGRGYKLHAVVDAACGVVEALAVTALDAGEATVMRRLVAQLDLTGCTLRGDGNYDSNPLYRAVADRGGRLVAPRRKPGTKLGHHPQHPDRVRAIEELEPPPPGGGGGGGGGGDLRARRKVHERHRIRVEQGFGHLTNLPGGLAPLPNFVRRLTRVTRWVAMKLALYHVHLLLSRARAAA